MTEFDAHCVNAQYSETYQDECSTFGIIFFKMVGGVDSSVPSDYYDDMYSADVLSLRKGDKQFNGAGNGIPGAAGLFTL